MRMQHQLRSRYREITLFMTTLVAACAVATARQPQGKDHHAALMRISAAELSSALLDAQLTPEAMASADLSTTQAEQIVHAAMSYLQSNAELWREVCGQVAEATAEWDAIRTHDLRIPQSPDAVVARSNVVAATVRKSIVVQRLREAATAGLADDAWAALEARPAEAAPPVAREKLDELDAAWLKAISNAVAAPRHREPGEPNADDDFINILERMERQRLTREDLAHLDQRTREFLLAPFGDARHTWHRGETVYARLHQPWWLLRPDQDRRLEIREEATGRLVAELMILRYPNRPLGRSLWSDYVHSLGPAIGEELAFRVQLFDLSAPDPNRPIAEERARLPIDVVDPETPLRRPETSDVIAQALANTDAALDGGGNLLLTIPEIDEKAASRIAVGLAIEIQHGDQTVGRGLVRPWADRINPLMNLVDGPGLDDPARPIDIEWSPGFDWRKPGHEGPLTVHIRGSESVAARDPAARAFWTGEVRLPLR